MEKTEKARCDSGIGAISGIGSQCVVRAAAARWR